MVSSFGVLLASSNVKKRVCFMSENHVYDPVLMVLTDHFRTMRLSSRGTPHGHGYCCARPARSIIEKMLQDSWLLHIDLMIFNLCSVVLDVVLVMRVPEDVKLWHARGKVR